MNAHAPTTRERKDPHSNSKSKEPQRKVRQNTHRLVVGRVPREDLLDLLQVLELERRRLVVVRRVAVLRNHQRPRRRRAVQVTRGLEKGTMLGQGSVASGIKAHEK